MGTLCNPVATYRRLISETGEIKWCFIGDWSPISCSVISECAQIIRHTSQTCLRIIASFAIRIQKEHINALYHFNFTMVSRAGKKTKETAPSAETRLEKTAMVDKLFDSERQHFYMHFLSMIARKLVINQSSISCNQSPKIRRLIINHSQLIGDHTLFTLSPNMGIMGIRWLLWSPVNRN